MIRTIKSTFRLVETVIVGTGRFLAAQWNQYNSLGQLLFVLALLAVGVDAGIAGKYGWSQTFLHAAGFALVAIAFCILPDVANEERRKGNKVAAGWIAAACIPLGFVAYQSHVGYSSSIRVGDMQQSGFKNASLETQQANLSAAQKALADLQSDRKKAVAERDAKMAANPWAANTNAVGIKAEIESLKGDFVFKRSKQCKDVTLPESRAHCDKIAKAENRLGEIDTLNKASDEIKRLDDRIDTQQKLINAKTAEIKTQGYDSSTVVNQNGTIASLVNYFVGGMSAEDAIKPTQVHLTFVNMALAGANSLGFMLLAPILWLAAGCNRIAGAISHAVPAVEQQITEAVHTIRNTPKPQPSNFGLKLSTISDLKRLAAA